MKATGWILAAVLLGLWASQAQAVTVAPTLESRAVLIFDTMVSVVSPASNSMDSDRLVSRSEIVMVSADASPPLRSTDPRTVPCSAAAVIDMS